MLKHIENSEKYQIYEDCNKQLIYHLPRRYQKKDPRCWLRVVGLPPNLKNANSFFRRALPNIVHYEQVQLFPDRKTGYIRFHTPWHAALASKLGPVEIGKHTILLLKKKEIDYPRALITPEIRELVGKEKTDSITALRIEADNRRKKELRIEAYKERQKVKNIGKDGLNVVIKRKAEKRHKNFEDDFDEQINRLSKRAKKQVITSENTSPKESKRAKRQVITSENTSPKESKRAKRQVITSENTSPKERLKISNFSSPPWLDVNDREAWCYKLKGLPRTTSTIQGYIWAMLHKGRDCFAVGPSQCGKTTALVAAAIQHAVGNPLEAVLLLVRDEIAVNQMLWNIRFIATGVDEEDKRWLKLTKEQTKLGNVQKHVYEEEQFKSMEKLILYKNIIVRSIDAIKFENKLKDVTLILFDDVMIPYGSEKCLSNIYRALEICTAKKKQICYVSVLMGLPEFRTKMKDPARIYIRPTCSCISPSVNVEQRFLKPQSTKDILIKLATGTKCSDAPDITMRDAAILPLLTEKNSGHFLIFFNNVDELIKLRDRLKKVDIECGIIYENKPNHDNEFEIANFKRKPNSILLTTDMALSLTFTSFHSYGQRLTVINYEIPRNQEIYVRRIGRASSSVPDKCPVAYSLMFGTETSLLNYLRVAVNDAEQPIPLELAKKKSVIATKNDDQCVWVR